MATSVSVSAVSVSAVSVSAVSVSAVMAQPTEITTIERERDVDVNVDVDGENNTKIFRYKLSNDILSIITQFAKIHQLDDRHSYKEAWEVWLNENKECIEDETDRLVAAGYKGDVEEKMYIAGRYYFREKVKIKKNKGEGKKVAAVSKKKREYIVMGKDFIKAIDVHLLTAMKQKGFKPAFAYKTFCEQHIELLRTEIRRLVNEEKHIFTDKDMNMKIKKTYKNRYFMLSKADKGEGEDSENED